MEKGPIGFALAIMPQRDSNGNLGFEVTSQSFLRKEVVLTLVRAWLRKEEDKHFENFKARN